MQSPGYTPWNPPRFASSAQRKTFYAHSLPEAIGQVRGELGPQALIISMRPVSGSGYPAGGVFEVIAESSPVQQAALTETREEPEVGGLGAQLARIREVVVLPLTHPEMFERLGIDPPRGILMCGPPGCGKTLIARTLARTCGATFLAVSGPEMMGANVGESEKNLRDVFGKAAKQQPSVVFLDEIDAIGGKREQAVSGTERRLLTQLLTLMDGFQRRERVVVLAATNRPNDLDPALRRSGRFDREVEIPVPDEPGRLEILRIHTRKMTLAPDVSLQELASQTHGFVGADLANVCREAGLAALREAFPGGTPKEAPSNRKIVVCQRHFRQALCNAKPSSLRSGAVEVPKVTWDAVGGLEDVKRELHEAIVMPLKEPELFRKMAIQPPKGVLLAGPPGTGKTLIARATASECGANFILVNGPSLVSKYVGESEKAVREVFAQARQASPCVIFFDEFDAIASARGGASGENEHGNRLVAQLLVEMDGFEPSKSVFCLAATNRPDAIDPALLRPGRFDKTIEIPLPDEASRRRILQVHLREKPLERNCDLEAVLPLTDGLSGAEIAEGCRRAAMSAIRKVMSGGGRLEPAISQRDLADAFQEVAGTRGRKAPTGLAPRALVLDDEAPIREFSCRALSSGGFEAVPFSRGEDALAAVQKEHFDLAVLDINMPGMDGLDVLARLRSLQPNLPVIMATARQDAATATRSFKLGALDYVTKPFGYKELVTAARHAMGRGSGK